MNIFENEDEMGRNGLDKQIAYKAEKVFLRSVGQLRNREDPGYGSEINRYLVIHLGVDEMEPVKLPITALVKCRSVDDVVALIETQYAIQKLQ